jgi:hypothetical protein
LEEIQLFLIHFILDLFMKSKEEEIVQKAFDKLPFQDPSNLLSRFLNFINECLHQYETTDDYYASYATLTQASGTEKSKLLQKTVVSYQNPTI